MCTAILLYKVIPSCPIVVAGNRDEFLARPALAPHIWTVPGENPPIRIFAGRDQKEGGTWFGINPYGLVVGVTNRYTGERDPGKCSRGRLVLDCLARDSVDRALGIVTEAQVSRYNPFNLFCLSKDSGFIVSYDGRRLLELPLDEGIHVLTNRAPDDPRDSKRDWLRSRLSDLPPDPETTFAGVSQLLASHHGEGDSPSPVCVHLPGYGTVSSFLLSLGDRKDRSRRYLYAHGAPCQTPFQDLTQAFLTLFPS